MIHSPSPDQWPAVSTTVRPLTQTAEAAVKSAMSGVAPPGPCVAAGMESIAAPTTLAARNAAATYCAGWRRAKLDLSLRPVVGRVSP